MQLEAQFPNELGSPIDWNLIPKLGVGISFRLLFALPKYPNRSVGSRSFPEFRSVRHAPTMYHMASGAADEGPGVVAHKSPTLRAPKPSWLQSRPRTEFRRA
jgi:hypothetical protein